MDRFDERILRELTNNGRLANVELAERIGLSPSATLRRVQELERNGVIKGYHARLDEEKLGIGFIAYVTIGLASHTQQAQKEFERHIVLAEQVTECHNITGSTEYLLRVETKDLASYKHFHSQVLGEIPPVKAITTLVVMDTVKTKF